MLQYSIVCSSFLVTIPFSLPDFSAGAVVPLCAGVTLRNPCAPSRSLLVYSASPQLSKCAKPSYDLSMCCVHTAGPRSLILKSLKILYNSHVYLVNATQSTDMNAKFLSEVLSDAFTLFIFLLSLCCLCQKDLLLGGNYWLILTQQPADRICYRWLGCS